MAAYLAAVGYLVIFQRDFVFRPSGILDATMAEAPGLEVVGIDAADGTPLVAWYRRAEAGQPTLLYFHGNAGNLGGRSERFEQVIRSGYGLLAMNYRGYGGAPGAPSEEAFFEDALAAHDWLAERANRIVIYGESLGTGVATYLASERPATALVLEAPFTATVDIAAETYPWIPVRWLMWDQFRSRDRIAAIGMPLLIVQGTEDDVVPPEHGRRLFEIAKEPKEIEVIQGAGHGNLWQNGLWRVVTDFVESVEAGGGRGPDQAAAAVRRMPSFAGAYDGLRLDARAKAA